MVFPSIPAYLDPANWHQQQSNQQAGASSTSNQSQLLPTAPPPPPPLSHPHGGSGPSSIRPGSMADRARLANIPMPEAALKCPRCDSTNTKFCYFNNYSLSQPRHFCKTCRRYWTCGGAIRNVPVGGGCRRNKRTKAGGGSSSKSSQASSVDRQSTNSVNSSSTIASTAADIVGLGPGIPPLRLMAPLQNLTDFPGVNSIGLNLGSVSGQISGGTEGLDFPTGGVNSGSSLFPGLDQWRLTQQAPQFPFMVGLDSSAGIFPFEAGGVDTAPGLCGRAGPGPQGQLIPCSGAPTTTQLCSVKFEESHGLNLSRPFLPMNNNPAGNDQQYWNAAAASATSSWTDLSSFISSSTSNPL